MLEGLTKEQNKQGVNLWIAILNKALASTC